ncbi:hypothetical protein JCM5350_004026 [Sporobolomyces pararoseus]
MPAGFDSSRKPRKTYPVAAPVSDGEDPLSQPSTQVRRNPFRDLSRYGILQKPRSTVGPRSLRAPAWSRAAPDDPERRAPPLLKTASNPSRRRPGGDC